MAYLEPATPGAQPALLPNSQHLPLTPATATTSRFGGPTLGAGTVTEETTATPTPSGEGLGTPQTPTTSTSTPAASSSRPRSGPRRQVDRPSPGHASFLRQRVTHYQQAADADRQLARLIDRCTRPNAPLASSKTVMAEALLGLAPASGLVDPTNTKFPVSHVDQLQNQLRQILERKSSATRSEHVSVSFDIRPTVQFTITTAENDNDGAAQIDPALGGSATPIAPTTRLVRVNDTVMNQPQDNPATQRSVAKHVIGLLSAVDASSWEVRDISRGTQGWAFTYVCKDSMASWARQNAKNPAKALIGEYSLKELDANTTGRPAFDCRGSVSIAFSKSSRSINIKYDHTPFHKTVGQLIEHFRPPPRPVPEPPVESTETPKKTPRKRKSAAAPDGQQETDANGQLKKTPRKRKSEAEADGGQAPKRRKKKSDAGDKAPEAPMGEASGTANGTAQSKADHAVESGVHAGTLLNVPPAEAARRRETAIRLLSDSGVDPETLSADQFAIFANQSPDLQKESLAMLVQYGAERLRIVHPSNATAAAGASSADATPLRSPQSENSIAPPQANTDTPPSGKKRVRKSKGGEDTPAGKKAPKPKVSRGACSLCRGQKVKCDKAKPSCGPCQAAGLDCQYPLEVSRGSKPGGSSRKVTSAAEVEEEEESEQEVAAPALEPEAEPDDIETIDYTSNMPVANMLTPAVDTSAHHDYFPNTGFPPAPMSTEVVHGVAPSSLNYPEPPDPTYSQPQPESPRASHRKSGSSNRHELPANTSSNFSTAQSTGTGQQPATVDENQATYTALNNMQTLTNAALQQQSASSTVQPAQTVSPAQQSPFQAPAQVARSRSSAGQRAQTRTPLADKRTSTPSHRTVQKNVPAAAPPVVDTPAYGSTTDMAGSSTYNTNETRYSNAANEHENSRLNYEPYAAQNAAATSNSYQPSSSYSTRASTASVSRSTQPSQQTATTSYTSNSGSHGRKAPAHSTGLSGASTSSYADPMAVSNRQTASLQSFNMRSAAASQPRNSSGYRQSDPKSYSDFSSTQPSSTRQQQQQQNSQQGWYGGFTPANTSASSYGTRSSTGYAGNASAENEAYQQQQQQHGQLNMSGHGYNGEADYFDLMRSMHPR